MTTQRSNTYAILGLVLGLIWFTLFNGLIAVLTFVPFLLGRPLTIGHACTLGIVVGATPLPQTVRWLAIAISAFYFRFIVGQHAKAALIPTATLWLGIIVLVTAVGSALLIWATGWIRSRPETRRSQYSIWQLMMLVATISFALAAWAPYVAYLPNALDLEGQQRASLPLFASLLLGSVALVLPLTAGTRRGKVIAWLITLTMVALISAIPSICFKLYPSSYNLKTTYQVTAFIYMLVLMVVAANIYNINWLVRHLRKRQRPVGDEEASTT